MAVAETYGARSGSPSRKTLPRYDTAPTAAAPPTTTPIAASFSPLPTTIENTPPRVAPSARIVSTRDVRAGR